MSRRFGRNQKRRLRERVQSLEGQLALAERMENVWREAVRQARADAVIEYANAHGLIEGALKYVSDKLMDKLGEELAPYAEKLLHARRDQARPLLTFTAHESERAMEQSVTIIRGRIETIAFDFALTSLRR